MDKLQWQEVKQSKIVRQKQVREMFMQNVSTAEIAKKLGVSYNTIKRDIQELDLRKDRTFIDGQIIRLHIEGYNHMEIGFEVDLSPSYVGKILKKYGYGREARTEDNLVDENTKYADNSVVLEKVTIDGKQYTDITQMLAPR